MEGKIYNQKRNDLRKRIGDEMTVGHSGVLERSLDSAKQFIRITKDGKVEVLPEEQLIGTDRILLYLIGKLYAKEAGFADVDDVGNKELMEELQIPEGFLLPWLKELRDENKIKQSERERSVYYTKRERYVLYSIPVNLVEATLKSIKDKLEEGS